MFSTTPHRILPHPTEHQLRLGFPPHFSLKRKANGPHFPTPHCYRFTSILPLYASSRHNSCTHAQSALHKSAGNTMACCHSHDTGAQRHAGTNHTLHLLCLKYQLQYTLTSLSRVSSLKNWNRDYWQYQTLFKHESPLAPQLRQPLINTHSLSLFYSTFLSLCPPSRHTQQVSSSLPPYPVPLGPWASWAT